MTFTHRGRSLDVVGVVGSGQIGPDIALYFSKILAPFGTRIIVVDISEAALAKGRQRVDRKIDKGVESGAFEADQAQTMKDALTFTNEYAALAPAGLVVEAATEDKAIKAKIFALLETTCSPGTLLCSNSSHLEPEVIGSSLADRSRSAVIHYFFPAERNPMVEVVPSSETSPAVTTWLMSFYERIGKVPIQVKSRYGYALDPIFEGIFLAAARCVEQGLGSVKVVDAVAKSALGQAVGPFTAMNLTGGNPITAVGLDQYTSKILPWYATPALLRERLAAGTPWDVAGRGESVDIPTDQAHRITDALQGAYLCIVDEILTAGLVSLADLEMSVELALDMTPPAALVKKLGAARALESARRYASTQGGLPALGWLPGAIASGAIDSVPVVLRKDEDRVAVLTIRRPKVLNALNEAAYAQLRTHMHELRADSDVDAVVITGFGAKAFVSGADVNFLARIDSPETGMADAREAQSVADLVENLGKPVVCAMNGVAFGGGMELAMACTARVVREDLATLGAQPEVRLGIIPGAGGTQRLPRWIGVERAAEYLRSGKSFSARDAVSMGLASKAAPAEELLPAAVAFAKDLAAGRIHVTAIPKGPLSGVPRELPPVALGHLSRAVDAILCRAILEGARTTLDRGLAIENACFGDVCRTEDMRTGLDTFLKQGPRAKAAFAHR